MLQFIIKPTNIFSKQFTICPSINPTNTIIPAQFPINNPIKTHYIYTLFTFPKKTWINISDIEHSHLPCRSLNKESILTLFPTINDYMNTLSWYYCPHANAIWKSKAIKRLVLSKVIVKMRKKSLLRDRLIYFHIFRRKSNRFLS